MLAVVAFLLGQRFARNDGADAATAAPGGAPFAVGGGAGGGGAPDISQMSPEERATRLFDRVMRYGEEGKLDSARIFAPMAMQAYEMMGPADAHSRYDIGMIAVVASDVTIATAQADTILRGNPEHLLGLILAMKAADLRKDAVARKKFEKRFVAASGPERAKKLKEYTDHASDIDAALKRSAGPRQ